MLHTQSTGLGDIDALLAMENGVSNGHRASPSALWALDPRLPRIAAQAAIEFDWIIQATQSQSTTPTSQESIEELYSLLSESVQHTSCSDQRRAFDDSLGLHFFAQAFNQTQQHPVNTRAELIEASHKFTDALHKAHQNKAIDKNILEHLRDFCVALSDYASAYRRTIYGYRPEHPYRK